MPKTYEVVYNDGLEAEDQVDTEEDIARLIFDYDDGGDEACRLGEEDCAELGRQILKYVLQKFRPDLFSTIQE